MANGDDKYKGVTVDDLHRDPAFGKLSPAAQTIVINKVLANKNAPTESDRQVMSGPLRFVSSFTEGQGLPADIRTWPESMKNLAKNADGSMPSDGRAALGNVAMNLARGFVGAHKTAAAQGIERFNRPGAMNKVGGAFEYLESGIPGIGPNLVKAGRQAEGGDYAGSAGTTAAVGSQLLVGSPEARSNIAKGITRVTEPIERSAPRVMIRGQEYPALKGEIPAEQGGRASIEQGMKRSFTGGPLRKVARQQQSFAQNLISTIATDKAGIAPKPEDFIGNVERAGEAIRKDASKEYDAIAEDLAKGAPVPGQTEVGPAAKTASTREEALRNYQLVEQSAKKAYEKPYHQLTPDEQRGLLETFGLDEGDITNPKQKASSMKAAPSTSRGAALQFKMLQSERHAVSEQKFSAIKKGDWTAVRELQGQMEQTEASIDTLMKAQKQPELYNRYLAAKARTAQAYAIKEVGATLDSVTKGLTKAQQEGAGFKPSAQEIGGPQLVEKLKDLDRQLPRAFGQKDAAAIRQTAEMLRRGQEKGGMMGGFAHYATSIGPAAYAVEELFRGQGTQGLEYAAGMYGGLWLASKALASRSGRIAMVNFLRALPGSAEEGLWRSRITAVAAASSGASGVGRESRTRPSPQPAESSQGQTPSPQSSQ